jgi:hypothetical protein
VAEDFLRDPQVRQSAPTFDSLRALRQEPSAMQTAIQITNDLNADEVGASPISMQYPHPAAGT